MFPTRFSPTGSPETGASSAVAPQPEKRLHESSSDDDQKPNPNKLLKSQHSQLSKTLRAQLPGHGSDDDIPMLPGPFAILNRISGENPRENPPVYQVSNPDGGNKLAVKVREDTPGSSADSREEQRDLLRHSVQIYRKIGAHPNINPIHGMTLLTVNGVAKEGLVMDKGDLNLLEGIELFGAAREQDKLSEQAYFGVVLPGVARALIGAAAHCAKANISHGDIDPANVLLFEDGRAPQLVDHDGSQEHPGSTSAGWPAGELEAHNVFASVYPADRTRIVMTLRHLASARDGSPALGAPRGTASPEIEALRDLLARSNPAALGNRQSTPADFSFLQLGTDQELGRIVAELCNPRNA